MKIYNTDEVRAAIAAIDKKFMEDVNRGDAAAGAAAYRHSRENRRLENTWPK
jgi:hypothetical protein